MQQMKPLSSKLQSLAPKSCPLFRVEKPPMPLAQHRDNHSVPAPAEKFHARKSAPRRKEKLPEKQRQGDHTILPAIQPPLMLPKPERMPEKRLPIRDRPQILRRRPARTDQVAQQMQMKCQQAKQQDAPALAAKAGQQPRNQKRTRPPMKQIMMLLLVIVKRVFPSGNRGADHVCDDAQAVGIGKNSRQGYKSAVARIARGCGGDQPASEEMCDRRHKVSAPRRRQGSKIKTPASKSGCAAKFNPAPVSAMRGRQSVPRFRPPAADPRRRSPNSETARRATQTAPSSMFCRR